MRMIVVSMLLVLVLVGPAYAQVGEEIVVTMNLAGPVKSTGGSYYIAFNVDDSILTGPQSDSSNWTHYILYRGGRFYFGRVPATPFHPFGFEAIRPPEPYPFGQVAPDGRSIRVAVALSRLRTAFVPPTRVKINLVTVNDRLLPFDALGAGSGDRFAFVTFDLRGGGFVAIHDPVDDAADPAFDITGGEIQSAVP